MARCVQFDRSGIYGLQDFPKYPLGEASLAALVAEQLAQ